MENYIQTIEKPEMKAVELEQVSYAFMLPFTMKKSFNKLMSAVDFKLLSQNLPPYARYFNFDVKELMECSFIKMMFFKFNYALGLPLADEAVEVVQKQEPFKQFALKINVIPASRYLKIVHRGPYKNLGKTHRVMSDYIISKNIKYLNTCFEFYISDPTKTAAEDLQTEILYQIE